MRSKDITVSYCKGEKDNKVAFVFLCPGQIEEILNKPICGATGAHLECLILELQANESLVNYFKYNCRYKYRIINLSENVYYDGSKNGTKPNKLQVESEENIKRLRDAMEGMELILVFDIQYKNIFQNQVLFGDKDIIYSRHLSSRSINQIDKDINSIKIVNNSEGNLKMRIKVIAKEIIEQFKRDEV